MARIPEDILDAIRRSVDIAELVSRYVPLKRSGRGRSGLCPFHQEKTPSFYVWPETGTWKCFGCGKGGNGFTFLMEKEGLRFFEAAQQLARDAGIALPEDDDPEAAARAVRAEQLRAVNEWACKHFEAALRPPGGTRGADYFKRRGITGATAREFRLGYAPPGWDNLLIAARRDGVAEADLLDAGLVKERSAGGGYFDFFHDRVVFPISDARGRVIAFGARTLGDDEPKYLNSRETPIFSKGKNLYAFHLAKSEMLRSGEGAVMEGYTDVILAHQAGYKVAVAGLGTALTPDQAKQLAQYTKKLWLVYDGDAAGLRAAEKAIPAFLPESIETRVCVLPGGKDPADVFVEDGVGAFRASLAASREAFDHLISARTAANDVSTVPGKSAAIEECLTALVGVRDDMRRALYVKRLADAFGVPEDVATRTLQTLRNQAERRERRAPPAHAPRTGSSAAPSRVSESRTALEPPRPDDGEPWVHSSESSAGTDDPHGTEYGAEPGLERDAGPPPPAERLLVEALLGAPGLLAEVPDWLPGALSHGACRRLLALLIESRANAGGAPDPARVVGSLSDPALAAFAAELTASGAGKPDLLLQGRDCLVRLESLHEERRLREDLLATGSDEAEADLLRRLQAHHKRRASR